MNKKKKKTKEMKNLSANTKQTNEQPSKQTYTNTNITFSFIKFISINSYFLLNFFFIFHSIEINWIYFRQLYVRTLKQIAKVMVHQNIQSQSSMKKMYCNVNQFWVSAQSHQCIANEYKKDIDKERTEQNTISEKRKQKNKNFQYARLFMRRQATD